MFIYFCYALCFLGLFEIVVALSTKGKDADWDFLKGICLVVLGVMLGMAVKCVWLS